MGCTKIQNWISGDIMKSCPFCGEKTLIDWMEIKHEENATDYAYTCITCSSIGPTKDSRIEAEIAWNERSR